MSFVLVNSGITKHGTRVFDSGQVYTKTVSESEQAAATEREDSFNINSGTVSENVATQVGILYLKNNEDRDLHITGIVTITGACTNGTENNVKIWKNPSAGTLIDSSPTNADTNSNRNFGSTKTLTADVYKGEGGSTVTDGTVHIESIVPCSTTPSRVFFAIDEVLTKGDSVAVTFTMAGNNSSTNCMAAIICHLEDPAK